MTAHIRLEQLTEIRHDVVRARVLPPVVHPDSALARTTDALGGYASGSVVGQRLAQRLVSGQARALVLAGHPAQGKTTLSLDVSVATQNLGAQQGRQIDPVRLDVVDDIAEVKAANGGSVVGWENRQWNEVDARFRRRLAQAFREYRVNRPIIIETGGTENVVDGVVINQGGGALQWAIQEYPGQIITTFVTAAESAVPQSAGDTRQIVKEVSSRDVAQVLRRDHSVSYVGRPTSVIRDVVRGAPANVIQSFEREKELAAQAAGAGQLAEMMEIVQPPTGVSLSDQRRAHRNAAVYALRMRQLGVLGSHNGLSTVLYTYRPQHNDTLRVRFPH